MNFVFEKKCHFYEGFLIKELSVWDHIQLIRAEDPSDIVLSWAVDTPTCSWREALQEYIKKYAPPPEKSDERKNIDDDDYYYWDIDIFALCAYIGSKLGKFPDEIAKNYTFNQINILYTVLYNQSLDRIEINFASSGNPLRKPLRRRPIPSPHRKKNPPPPPTGGSVIDTLEYWSKRIKEEKR